MESALAAAIRCELQEFAARSGRRRTLDTTCHVGHPGGERTRVPRVLDASVPLRADLVERAIDGLDRTHGACSWLTRGGGLERCDADAEWFAAALTAFARHGLELPAFFVVNRTGWVDLVSGESRVWSRIRHRSPAA